jgi:hypothetical protein
MKLPEVSTYRFVSETIANLALRELTQALAGNLKFKDGHAFYPGVRIDNGHPVNIDLSMPTDAPPIQNLETAQTLAALLIRSKGVQLPGKALGDAASQLIIQLALYGATQLGGQWLPLIQSVLTAAGVNAPTSIPGILTGAIKETFMAVKIEDFEVLQALGVGLQDAGKKLQAAKQPGSPGGVVVTTGEKIDIIEVSVTDAVKALLGDEVPGLDKYIAMGVALAGMILPLVFKDPVPPAA